MARPHPPQLGLQLLRSPFLLLALLLLLFTSPAANAVAASREQLDEAVRASPHYSALEADVQRVVEAAFELRDSAALLAPLAPLERRVDGEAEPFLVAVRDAGARRLDALERSADALLAPLPALLESQKRPWFAAAAAITAALLLAAAAAGLALAAASAAAAAMKKRRSFV